MKTLFTFAMVTLLIGCAPLYPHNTLGEDIGEVALRVVGCPLTLCVTELQLHERRRQQAQAEAHAIAQEKRQQRYQKWYQTLSPEEQAREDYNNMELAERERDRQALREAAALNALGQINQGRGLLGPGYTPPPVHSYTPPTPAYNPPPRQLPRQGVNCISSVSPYGGQVTTDCY